MWYHYIDNNNHNTADCRAIAIFKQQKIKEFLAFQPNLELERSLWHSLFFFEEVNALKSQLNPEKNANSKQ
jgi:hypothetical protein